MKSAIRIILLILLQGPGLSCLAQSLHIYQFQEDDSLLKRKYYEESMRKKKSVIASFKEKKEKNADDYKSIYEGHFDEIGKLWLSSRTVTAREAHGYLQEIVARIVSSNPELSGTDARVVFTRDGWPNAFSAGDGTIVINAGLFIFLDNEAELVFTICHELAHYYLEHTPKKIKQSVERINSEEVREEIRKISRQEYGVGKKIGELARSLAFDKHRHSREYEAEADRVAFRYLRRTGFDCLAAKSCLELLDKVDDSLLHRPVNVEQLFQFPEYPFRKKWVAKESAIFSEMKEDDSPLTAAEKDSLKTHPDCMQRIALLEDSLAAAGKDGRKFIVNERLFRKLKNDFRPEIAEQLYRDENLGRNLYNSLALLQNPEWAALGAYSVARCLNDMYAHQKAHRLGLRVGSEHRAFPHDYNLLLRMIGRLRLEELASINYYFCKKYEAVAKDHPGFYAEMKKAESYLK